MEIVEHDNNAAISVVDIRSVLADAIDICRSCINQVLLYLSDKKSHHVCVSSRMCQTCMRGAIIPEAMLCMYYPGIAGGIYICDSCTDQMQVILDCEGYEDIVPYASLDHMDMIRFHIRLGKYRARAHAALAYASISKVVVASTWNGPHPVRCNICTHPLKSNIQYCWEDSKHARICARDICEQCEHAICTYAETLYNRGPFTLWAAQHIYTYTDAADIRVIILEYVRALICSAAVDITRG